MKQFPTIFKRTATGAIQQWTITADGPGYTTTEGIVGGKLTTSAIHTVEPKNTGKKNATTPEATAEKEAESKWEKKLRRGYTTQIAQVDAVTFEAPMKGDKFVDRADEVVYPVTVQRKLNGVRYQNNAFRAYSTGGETFHTTPHIRQALAPIFEKYPQGFIDGEAYNHDDRRNLNRLIKIVSVVIKPKDLTPELLAESERLVRFHVFDGYGFPGITKETPWKERHAAVGAILKEFSPQSVFLEPFWEASSYEQLLRFKEENLAQHGEGLMIRWSKCEFKNGRSKYLLKLKHFDDAEFIIADIQEGNGDWAGCAKRIVLLLPKPTPTGETTFAANIEGDRDWLRTLFSRRAEFIGQPATVEYQHLSEYGVPQIPFVRAIRNYE